MLTVRMAAKLLGVSAATVYALAAARRIGHLRVGTPGRRGKIVFTEADVEAYKRSCRVEPVETGPAPATAPAARPKRRAAFKHISFS